MKRITATTLILLVSVFAAPALAQDAEQNECLPPVVLLIVDKSGSMLQDSGTPGKAKIDVATDALKALVSSYAGSVSFGLAVFPSAEVDACTVDQQGTLLLTPVAHPGGPLTSTVLSTAIGKIDPLGQTPLIKTMEWAKAWFAVNTYPGQSKIIILITDGKESCNCSTVDPENCIDDDAVQKQFINSQLQAHVGSLSDPNGQNVRTYVIGFSTLSNEVSPSQLNTIAISGKTANDPACYSPGINLDIAQCYLLATDQTSLNKVLNDIAADLTKEVCDGIDNNCDGKVDEGLGNIECGEGDCKNTVEACVNGKPQTCTPKTGGNEICDGKDNNCNGLVDENFADVGTDCTKPGENNQCPLKGKMICSLDGNSVICDAKDPITQGAEVCDGIDNDCNGVVDDTWKDQLGTECTVTQGQCSAKGKWVCSADKKGVVCDTSIGVNKEICDNKDNDCDGVVDKITESCPGTCGVGTRTCTEGKWSDCSEDVKPNVEICDGLDNDCNGKTDDGADCGPDSICACGGCQKASVNGECLVGFPLGFFCVVDKCPEPLRCNQSTGNCDGTPIKPGDLNPDSDSDTVTPDANTPDGSSDDASNGETVTPTPDGTADDGMLPGDGTVDDGSGPGDTTTPADTSVGTDTGKDGDSKGCGCNLAQQNSLPLPGLVLILFGLLVWRRRRTC